MAIKPKRSKVKEKPEGYTFGRPTLYKPEYCEQLIEHMAKGLSFESFAAVVGTGKQTLYNWKEVHKDFLDAAHTGIEKSRLYFENAMATGIWNENFGQGGGSKSLNSSMVQFIMKNRFPDEYRDKTEVESTVTAKVDVVFDTTYGGKSLEELAAENAKKTNS